MSRINVDNIVNRSDDAAPTILGGATIPTGVEFKISGNFNSSGVGTISNIEGTNTNVSGALTATSFYGDGSSITNLPSITSGKAFALRNLLDVLPHRA